MAKVFEVGTWIWKPDAEEKSIPAQVKQAFRSDSKSGVVQTEDGEEHELDEKMVKEVLECNPEILGSQKIDDLVDLSDLNENAILHNLRIRYKSDAIYTNISSILISVNPFKLLPIYTSAILDNYRQGYIGKAPHVYGVAFNAYRDMLRDDLSQSVVISGESGAGKSEATKLILQFLTDVSARNSNPDQAPIYTSASTATATPLPPEDLKAARRKSLILVERISTLEQQILAANPILEAFGNAKTLRNNNSSRFGKLITIDFDKAGSIVGGQVITYLLEKTRIVSQTQGERNYHVFYQLLAQAINNPALAQELQLKSPELFTYTGLSGVTKIDGKSDEIDFEEVQNSFKILRFPEDERREIYRLVAGVLHFGNVKFKVEKNSTGDDGSSIVDEATADLAASLWGVDAATIKKYLVGRDVGSAKESYYVAYSVNQASDARDAMVKRVYSELFSYMVEKINVSLSTGIAKHRFIGVLDIFGFESFEVNSFEQLCINFCNEKLQFHFNEHIFRMEQTLYAAEGIQLSGTAFVDNQPTLDLLELKGTGLFSMIDEEINVPKGTDEGFLSKVFQKHGDGKHPNLLRPKAKDCKDFLKNFGVNHYAGPVFYNVSNFLEKNRDSLHPNILSTLKETKSSLACNFFKESTTPASSPASTPTAGGGSGGGVNLKSIIQSKILPPVPAMKSVSSSATAKAKTLGTQFKEQLNELMKTLNITEPHFIRCVKPNDKKIGNNFNAYRIMDQLRYAGIVEVCRIRKLGYPDRKTFKEFYSKFALLDKRPLDSKSKDFDSLSAHLDREGILKAGLWAKGNTKIFMRQVQTLALDDARDKSLWGVATFLQKYVRGCVHKWRYKKYRAILKELKDCTQRRDKIGLQKAVENSAELPFCSGNKKRKKELAIIVQAKALIDRLLKEEQIERQLAEAIKIKDLVVLKNAVKAHSELQPVFDTPLLATATSIIERIEMERACVNKLRAALSARNLDLLNVAITEAQNMSLTGHSEIDDAKSLRERIVKENDLIAKIVQLTSTEDLESLSVHYQQCLELNLNDRQEVKAANIQMKAIVAKKEAAERAAEEERQRKAREEAEAKRLKALNDAKAKLVAAKEKKDLDFLAIAVKEANELNEQVPDFQALIKQCQETSHLIRLTEHLTNQFVQMMKVLSDKEANGVTQQDVANLDTILQECQRIKLSEIDCPKQVVAKEYVRKYSEQVRILDELQLAVEKNSLHDLRTAVGNAENVKLSTPLVKKAQEALRELEIADRAERAKAAVIPLPTPAPKQAEVAPPSAGTYNSASSSTNKAAAAAASSSTPAPELDPKAALKQMNLKRQQVAMQAKYEFKNFPRLRSLDDFARGAILNKSKIKESMLIFVTNSIPKSLLDLSKELNKMAIDIHKDLMCYMGDKSAPFPTTLAQDILKKGFENPELRDEIYALIIKQLTQNSRAESIAKGWQMMCMCVGTFPPSYDAEHYLLHYILMKRDTSKGAIVDYAKYCLRTLEAMLSNGDGTGFVPSVEEILAYKERPPILASIYLVDGSIITEDLPITPDLTVSKILEMCFGWLDLKDPRSQRLGMFVYDLGSVDGDDKKDLSNPHDDLVRTPRPLRGEDYMGDVIVQKARQRRKFKFVIKKKIFLPSENTRGDDPFYERMVYLQAEDEAIIQGNVQIDDEGDVPILSAISMTVAFGAELGRSPDEILGQGVVDFVVPSWRTQFSDSEWASAVHSYRDDLEVHQPEDLQEHFLQIVYKSPQYGMHWFYVHTSRYTESQLVPPAIRKLAKTERDIILGFNHEGIHIYRTNHQYEMSYVYADIYRWGGSANNFSLVVADETIPESFELIVITAQAADMAAIILDYIKAIMETSRDADDEDA